MNGRTPPTWRTRFYLAGIAGTLAITAVATLSAPAQARIWGSGPCCYYGPAPYYGYAPPYYYAPPPAAYYYPPAAYPAPAGPAPSAYTPPDIAAAPAQSYAPPNTPAPAGPAAAITYTSKPAFTNAAGQTCREYRTNGTGGQPVYGTACRAADGQWRVAN